MKKLLSIFVVFLTFSLMTAFPLVHGQVFEAYLTSPMDNSSLGNSDPEKVLIWENTTSLRAVPLYNTAPVVSTLFEYSVDGMWWTEIGIDTYEGHEGVWFPNGNGVGASGWNIDWDTTGLTEGPYYVRTTMTDAFGESTSDIQQVYYDPTPPRVKFVGKVQPVELWPGRIYEVWDFSVELFDSPGYIYGLLVERVGEQMQSDTFFQYDFGNIKQSDVGPSRPDGENMYCGPTAAANALWFLAQKDPELKKGRSTLDIAKILASSGFMNTSKDKGTMLGDVEKGLKAYLKEVKRDGKYTVTQPTGTANPTWKDYDTQLRENEAVIVLLGKWKDAGKDGKAGTADDNFDNGHYLTGEGVQNFTKSASFIDPGTGKSTGWGKWKENGPNGFDQICWDGDCWDVIGIIVVSPTPEAKEELGWDTPVSIGEDCDGSDGWSVPWDTRFVQDGFYVVQATILDSNGNYGTDRIVVHVKNQVKGIKEKFGPRLDKLLIKLYSSETAEFAALENGEIDITDSPLTQYWIARWSSLYNESIVLSYQSNGRWKAYRKQYTGGTCTIYVAPDDGENVYRGRNWEGIVNQTQFGVNSWGTSLSAHPEGFERGDGSNMTMRYGFRNSTLVMLNPIYSTSYWDWQVLDKIYDTMIIRNSSDLSTKPWLAKNYTAGTWLDPLTSETKTKISVALRHEATWADGTPLTAADVYFTLFELPRILETRGFPPPSWTGNVQDILDFKFLDPYNFEILLNTLDPSSPDSIGENIILPKHIWKPIVTTGDPTTFSPDPNMTGSGPWRLKEYVAFSHILMVANRPGSAVQTNLPGSANITSPQGYWRYYPILGTSTLDGATHSKVAYGEFHTWEVNVTNLWYGGPITLNTYWRTTWHNGTVTEETHNNIALNNFTQPGDTWTHSDTIILKGRIKIDTEITSLEFVSSIRSPSLVYATIKEDIAGNTLYDDIGNGTYPYKSELPSPDIKVDIKDVAIAAKAFGAYPGHQRWSTIADINNDYKIDIRDIASIARKYGWIG